MICGSLWGMSRAYDYRDKLKICDDILIIIRRTGSLMCCGCDTAEIISDLKAESDIFGNFPDDESSDDLNERLCRSVEKSELEQEEKTVLMRYCKELGTSDLEGQMAMLGSLVEMAAELRERRKEDYIKYGRLYRSVGILFGLMAGIAII